MRPDDRLRGLVDGFPVWPEPATADAGPVTGTLDRALAWLDDNLAWFDPALWNTALPARQFSAGPLLELLLLCREVPDRTADLTGRALDLADRLITAPTFLGGLHRGDRLFTYHVWLLGLMRRFGHPVAAHLTAVQAMLDAGCRPNVSGVSALELRYAVDLAGLTAPGLSSAPELYERWSDDLHLHPFQLADTDCYAITHAVFYVTEFGRVPLCDDRLNQVVRLLLDAYLAAGDFDLGAELLHSALLTGSSPGRRLWHRIAAAQREDGAVPGPLHQPGIGAKLAGQKAAAYAFGTCYHTTVVTALAAVEWERSGTTESGPESLRADPTVLRAIGADRLPAALVIAVRRRDLDLTAALLHTACESGMAGNPVVEMAATFLIAQRQADGSFGVPGLGGPENRDVQIRVRLPLNDTCAKALQIWETATRRRVS